MPSPVTATTSPSFFNSFTSVNLSVGELRARTCAAHAQDKQGASDGKVVAHCQLKCACPPAATQQVQLDNQLVQHRGHRGHTGAQP